MSEQQQNLFDPEPAPWELDDADERVIATVVLSTGPDGEFDYVVPWSLSSEVEVGRRVVVPLGRSNRKVIGYCVDVATRRLGPRKLKSVASVVDRRSLLSAAMLRLTRWIADYYLCSWRQVLSAVVPAAVRGEAGTRSVTLLSLSRRAAANLAGLELPPKQSAVLSVLAGSDQPMPAAQLAEMAGCTQAPITALRKRGLVESHVERIRSFRAEPAHAPSESPLPLNADQQAALDAILASLNSSQHQTVLIHGVTGSGKTEVYMQAMQEVIGFGRQAIVLVPEISLTPQTCERFERRFGAIAVLHSHLTDAERAWHWDQIAAGRVQVIVGARSAVFAPTPHLGMIVLDEEHDGSFKQAIAPRYHARDVAVQRASAENIPLVLGSATPSLESWQRAVEGHYRLVEMPRRVLDRPLPDVATVDLRIPQHHRIKHGAISGRLRQAMEAALKEGGQIILLLNRRGFSTHIQCPACGLVVRCPDCDLALTHHRQTETAICHYCDYQIPAPLECPKCHATDIRYSGRGTQKLEAEVRARFPEYACLRMDSDSMQRPGSHQRALDSFRRGEARILLGTQMIAKGLDFPNVTLVGVINADTALHLPDFRAAERTFHLVTQVAGRTGRGAQGGRVLVQTFSPEHPAIVAAARHDYARFARAELPIRKSHGYPPFASMIRLVIRGPAEKPAEAFAEHVAERIRAAGEQHAASVRVLGPAPAPIPRLRGKFRLHIQVQSPDGDRLRAAVRDATAGLKPPEEVEWIADVDPLDML